LVPGLLLAGLCLLASPDAFGVADKKPRLETVKDRAGFIPYRKHQALKGTLVGILLANGQPILSNEGRYGPPDQLVLGTGGASYRWVYVPAADKAIITNLQVPVGNGQTKVYPKLNMANPTTVKQWGITRPYTLVEVEVNDGLGSPAGDSFVATKMKVLDGTKEYPLKVAEVIAEARKRYAAYLKTQEKAIEKALGEAQKKALKEQKPTGPREQSELMFVSWLPESKKLRINYRTRISNGAYKIIERRFGRRLPPRGGLRPPPPRPIKIRTGTMFGVEFGMGYEASTTGKIERSEVLSFEPFQKQISVPVTEQVGGPIKPLPPVKK
jgi:hypothetical protein